MAQTKKRDVSIVERRLKSGQVFSAGSKPIPLIDPEQWEVRIVNSQIHDTHLWSMQADKGWVYLAPEDLAVSPNEIGFRVQDGRVVRGTHGQEVLMKMPKSDYRAIQKAKDAQNRQNTFGKKQVKAAIVGAAGQAEGSQSAEFLDAQLNQVRIVDTRERVPLDPNEN